MAFVPNVFCSICGLILAKPDDALGGQRWLARVRAVFLEGGYQRNNRAIRLTPVGFMNASNTLFAPSSDHYDPSAPPSQTIVLFQIRPPRWGYGFHDSCWELLLARLGGSWSEHLVAYILFRQLLCVRTRKDSSLDFGHEYNGALLTHQTFERRSCLSATLAFSDDPCCIYLDALEDIVPVLFRSRAVGVDNIFGGKPFGNLPSELLQQIISYLPYDQVQNLRLVCRNLAQNLAPEALPRTFWKDRFTLGSEHDFIFPDLNSKRDWRALFHATRFYIYRGILSLVTRKRIRDVLEPIAATIELELERGYVLPAGEDCLQFAKRWPSKDTPMLCLDSPASDMFYASLETSKLQSQGRIPPLGCRALHFRRQHFPVESNAQISISNVQFGQETYISGLSYSNCSREIGFCYTHAQEHVHIPPNTRIDSIKVVFSPGGLVGLQLIFSDGGSSPQIGTDQGKGIACGILKVPKSTLRPHLVVGLDNYKIVQIGIASDPSPLIDDSQAVLGIGLQATCEPYMWIPNAPPYKNLRTSALEPPECRAGGIFENRVVNLDFGGLCGEFLNTLTRIVGHMDTAAWPIVGITFCYVDGKERHFGHPGQTEITFYINGPGGERITRVIPAQDSLNGGMSGFEIWTNYGRRALFKSVRSHRNRLTAQHPLEVPEGRVLTGFAAISSGHNFVRMGIQTQPDNERSVFHKNMPNFSQEDLFTNNLSQDVTDPKSILEFETCASLKEVRKITASAGLPGRSRRAAHISGLKLDYYGQRPPAVVGQWLKEHDTFELSRNETIHSLIVRLNRSQDSHCYGNWNLGHVKNICVITSYSRVKILSPSGDVCPIPCPDTKFFSWTAPSGGNGTISWVLNPYYDRVSIPSSKESTEKDNPAQPRALVSFWEAYSQAFFGL